MLSLTNLSLRRGALLLFEEVTFTIHQGKRVGLIGANGSGKTSLFQLITGELEADLGNLDYATHLRIAHMKQEVAATNQTAVEYILAGDTALAEIGNQIEKTELEQNFHQLADLHEQLDSIDGYSARARAEQLLVGLGFSQDDFDKPVTMFSGGWRIRLNLGRTLMQPSDLLLLDEPTNHLDLDAILWLADWIKQYKGALLLISHDREFLDECVGGIAYLNNKSIELFKGNYSQFERVKAARLAEQQSSYLKQQREIEHMKDFVRRFRAKATKARQAQSRLKALERLELISAAHVDSPFHFTIPRAEKTSDPLLTLEMADLGYGDPVLRHVRLSLHPGDRFGLLGHNGAGKSTLVKSLSGEIPLIAGNRTEGTNLKPGYFSQHQVDDLNLTQSAFDHIQSLDKLYKEQEIRRFLGSFNFHGDKVKEPVETFSGGEKARLALAIIASSRPNLLLMDEPTNHLDMDMRQALTVALQSFEGAILLISHDRHLLANTINQFLLVDRGKVEFFNGDLNDYRTKVLVQGDVPNKIDRGKTKARKPNVRGPKQNHKVARQLRTRISTLEKRLERLHRKLSEVEDKLATPDMYEVRDNPDLQNLLRDQVSLQQQIHEAESQWMDLNTDLEAI
ncbi:MAG: ABC transporter ATP-binding protein [Gammaproteobacteria bacterium]|jgi:ATP-binding cassette subfamily F protein 3|nr:ABC transporter ATP-binding protein [Gammaproteobacteria bacterium]|tara:strand:+ start:2864 stop:4735 length:1872 start_codon:yes stop_codon:yes gene_type:complete